jgi:hypothetical protein
METGTIIFLVLVLSHLMLCLIALRMIWRTQVWSSSKKNFASITAVILILFGPILIILAIRYFAKSGASNPELKNSADLM